MLAEYDPDAEVYNWVQVIHHVMVYLGRLEIGFVYTPDCSKMLTFYNLKYGSAHTYHYMAYLNVADGSIKSMIHTNLHPSLAHRDAVAFNYNGSRVWRIYMRPHGSNTLHSLHYDEASSTFLLD